MARDDGDDKVSLTHPEGGGLHQQLEGRHVIGWREYVALPDWGVEGIIAKADTGARSSSIDVANLEFLSDARVRFDIVLSHKPVERHRTLEADVVRMTHVKSSFGKARERPFVATRLRIGEIEKEIEIGLVSRKNMLCRMLIGRKSLEPDLIVDPGHTYLFGRRKPRRRKGKAAKPRRTRKEARS